MKTIESLFRGGMAVAGAWLATAIGGWDALLATLVVCMALDYISGVIRAIHEGKLSSSAGFRGLLRKGCILLVVMVAAQIDQLALGESYAIRGVVCMFYVANESLSILENVAAVGIRLPEPLLKVLHSLQQKNENDLNKE